MLSTIEGLRALNDLSGKDPYPIYLTEVKVLKEGGNSLQGSLVT